MFGGDVTYERLWRRLLNRYPFMRSPDIAQSFEALFESSKDFTYRALKAVGEQRHRFEVAQMRTFLAQLHLLVNRDVVDVDPELLLEPLENLRLEQAKRWFQFGLHSFQDVVGLRQYLEQESDQSQAVLAGLEKGASGHDSEQVLRYYADALAGPGLPLKFLPPDSTAPRNPETLTLPDVVAAYPKEKRQPKESTLHFLLYKWLIIHEQSHRQAGTYQSIGEADAENGDGAATLVEWLRSFSDPCLAETLFHLFENVRVEARLKAQYPGFAEERERLMELEYLFRPEPSGRERFLELLLQRLHWDKSHIKPPRQWHAALQLILNRAAALPESDAGDSRQLTEFAYEQIEKLFDEPRLDEPLRLTLLPYEALLELDPPGAPPTSSGTEALLAELPEDDPDLDDWEREVEGGPQGNGADTFRYDEWDFREGVYRTRWCALRERHPDEADRIAPLDPPQVAKVRRAFEWMAEEDWKREKLQLQGDEVDLDVWVSSLADRRAGLPPPEKLYTQLLRKKRDLCAVVLLDQSDSTARLTPSGQSVIQIEREALRFLCEALEALRDEYAIYSYSGDGHRQVDCFPLKKFDERYGLTVQRRLEALQPLSQNRDGCGLRHVTRQMLAQDARTKLLLHITDGRPWDHGYTQRYALEDTKKAIQEARSKGIKVFGVVCDPHAPDYVKSTYGPGRWVIAHSVEALSDLLLGLYRRITW